MESDSSYSHMLRRKNKFEILHSLSDRGKDNKFFNREELRTGPRVVRNSQAVNQKVEEGFAIKRNVQRLVSPCRAFQRREE